MSYGDFCVFKFAKKRIINACKRYSVDGGNRWSEWRCNLLDLIECEWRMEVVEMQCAQWRSCGWNNAKLIRGGCDVWSGHDIPAYFMMCSDDGSFVIVPYFLKQWFGNFLRADDRCHAVRTYGWLKLFYEGDGFLILRRRVCVLRLPVGVSGTLRSAVSQLDSIGESLCLFGIG